jgi:hypothetical protein
VIFHEPTIYEMLLFEHRAESLCNCSDVSLKYVKNEGHCLYYVNVQFHKADRWVDRDGN